MSARLQQYLQLKLQEDEYNKQIIDSARGGLVLYGESITIMHFDSEYFAMSTPDMSETTLVGNKLILSKHLQRNCYFKFISRFKNKKVADVVSFDDEIFIQNCMDNQFLDFDEEPYNHYYDFNIPKEDPFRPLSYFVDPHCTSHKMLLTMKKENHWNLIKFWRHNSYMDNYGEMLRGDPIKGLDLIYVKNPEMKSHICADFIYQGEQPEIFYRRYLGIFEEEKISLNSI